MVSKVDSFTWINNRDLGLTLHFLLSIGDRVDGKGQAVVNHLGHLGDVEGVVPPHEVRLEDVVDGNGAQVSLVCGDEEAIAVPGLRGTLLLHLCRGRDGGGCSGGHCDGVWLLVFCLFKARRVWIGWLKGAYKWQQLLCYKARPTRGTTCLCLGSWVEMSCR